MSKHPSQKKRIRAEKKISELKAPPSLDNKRHDILKEEMKDSAGASLQHEVKREGNHIMDMLRHFSMKKHDANKEAWVQKDSSHGLLLSKKEDAKPMENQDTAKITQPAEVNITGLGVVGKKEEKKAEKPRTELQPIKKDNIKPIATYNFVSDEIPITINIFRKKGEFVPLYEVSISSITKTTEFILEKIREELTAQVSLGMVDILTTKDT